MNDTEARPSSCCGDGACTAKPKSHTDADGPDHSAGVTALQSWLVIISGVLIGLGFLARWTHLGAVFLPTALFAVATLCGGALVLPYAFVSARRLRLDMNLPLAVAGAWVIGEGAERAAMVFLFALAELLKSWSVVRGRRTIKSLLALTPQTALRKSATREPEETAVSDVTKAAANSTQARTIRLVEEAEEQKAPTQQFVDRFARYYTPTVFVLALLVALMQPLMAHGAWDVWIYRSLALFVIACPCALVIATPVSIVSGLTALARRDVLIKGVAFWKQWASSRRWPWTKRAPLRKLGLTLRKSFRERAKPRTSCWAKQTMIQGEISSTLWLSSSWAGSSAVCFWTSSSHPPPSGSLAAGRQRTPSPAMPPPPTDEYLPCTPRPNGGHKLSPAAVGGGTPQNRN